MQTINIGDTVRFLNDVGGGRVTAIRKDGMVMVEDENGFDIPTLPRDLVVVNRAQTEALRSPQAEEAYSSNVKTAPVQKTVVQKHAAKTEATQKVAAQHHTAKAEVAQYGMEEETLEDRIVRLEMTVKRLQQRLERLEDARALHEKSKQKNRERQDLQRRQRDEILEVDLHATELLDTTVGMSPADIKAYQLRVFNDTMQQHLKDKGKRIVFIHGNGEGVLRRALLDELRRSYKSCDVQDASFQQYGFGATMVTIR